MKPHIKYQRPGHSDFIQGFPYMLVYVKHVGPGRGHFWPQAYNLKNLARGPLNEATYQYQRPGPSGFRKDF